METVLTPPPFRPVRRQRVFQEVAAQLRLVMHAAETEHRIRIVRERFGTTTVRLLERYGLLSPRVLLSHALYLDAPGIRIHGTYDADSIGTYASHGCIRMYLDDAEELFGIVPVGTRVLIV